MSSDFGHWSRYWSTGALTSLPQDFSGNYDGEVAEFWHRQFRQVPEAARILDVCTGNGAIAMMAAQALPDARVTALDAAGIQPEQAIRHQPSLADVLDRVCFLPGQRLEDAELSAGGFDLVCSQYGLEYTQWDESAAVIAELLCPGGRLALVSHSPSSAMVETMQAEVAAYQALFALPDFAAFAQFAKRPAFSVERFRSALGRLAEALVALETRFSGAGQPLIGQVRQACLALIQMEPAGLAQQRQAAGGYAKELEAGHLRARDMLSVNQRLHDSPDWYRGFECQGLRLEERGSLYHRTGEPCGDSLVFVKK